MKRFEWSRPALIVGFVLSENLEASVYQTAQVLRLLVSRSAAGRRHRGFSWQFVDCQHMVYDPLAIHTAAEEAKAPRRRWPQIAFTHACVLLVVLRADERLA